MRGKGQKGALALAPQLKNKNNALPANLLSTVNKQNYQNTGQVLTWINLKNKRKLAVRELPLACQKNNQKYGAWCRTPASYPNRGSGYQATGRTPEEALWNAFYASTDSKQSLKTRQALQIQSESDLIQALQNSKGKYDHLIDTDTIAFYPPKAGEMNLLIQEDLDRVDGRFSFDEDNHYDFYEAQTEFRALKESDEVHARSTPVYGDIEKIREQGFGYVVSGFGTNLSDIYSETENAASPQGIFSDLEEAADFKEHVLGLSGNAPQTYQYSIRKINEAKIFKVALDENIKYKYNLEIVPGRNQI